MPCHDLDSLSVCMSYVIVCVAYTMRAYKCPVQHHPKHLFLIRRVFIRCLLQSAKQQTDKPNSQESQFSLIVCERERERHAPSTSSSLQFHAKTLTQNLPVIFRCFYLLNIRFPHRSAKMYGKTNVAIQLV